MLVRRWRNQVDHRYVAGGNVKWYSHSGDSLEISLKIKDAGTSLAVQWLRLRLPMQGVWVQSLVGELGSHMPHGQKKQTNIKNPIKQKQHCTNSIKTLKMVHIKKILKKKLKMQLPYDSATALLGFFFPQRNDDLCSHKNLYTDFQSSFIHNSSNWKLPIPSFNG